MFQKSYVNTQRAFRKFEEQMREHTKYDEWVIDNKWLVHFEYKAGPHTFVNYCWIYLWVHHLDEAGDKEWKQEDYICLGEFSIQNYNLQDALKKAKELINKYNIKAEVQQLITDIKQAHNLKD